MKKGKKRMPIRIPNKIRPIFEPFDVALELITYGVTIGQKKTKKNGKRRIPRSIRPSVFSTPMQQFCLPPLPLLETPNL